MTDYFLLHERVLRSPKARSGIMQSYRASSLFQPANLVRAIEQTMDPLKGLSHLYGSILAFPCTMVARTVAVMGVDFVMVDALHTLSPCFRIPAMGSRLT